MNCKKTARVICVLLCAMVLCACTQEEAITNTTSTTSKAVFSTHIEYDENDAYQAYMDGEYTSINLNEQNKDVEITKAGVYELTGTLQNGSVKITAGKEDVVRLILNNVTIESSYAAIYCTQAEKLIVSLPEGTTNSLSDGTGYSEKDAEAPTAALFSQDDMTINGTGALQVSANENDAITSKDTLKIMEGTYTIEAQDDGIVGRDFLYIHDGDFTITAQGDGLKTTYDTDDTKGNMVIEAGEFHIEAENDGLQAEHALTIYDGSFTMTTGGGSVYSSSSATANQPGGFGMWNRDASASTTETASAKGIKAGGSITIEGGTYQFDTSDDALHAGENMSIHAGNFVILTGDDGMHADGDVIINGGVIDIQKSYEGIEGSNVIFNGGDIQIIASDDGINAAGGNDTTEANGMPQDNFQASGDHKIEIHGGTIQVDASGDGIDSNGSILQDGGTLVINGPTDSGNGALDYDSSYEISGGTLFSIGMSGMAQTTSTSSTQNSIMVNLSSTQAAGSALYICDSEGNVLLGVAPTKSYNSVLISSSAFKTDSTYTIYTGGTGGNVNDAGFIETGITGGTLVEEVTLSSSVTTVGTGARMGEGMHGGDKGGNPREGTGPMGIPAR